MFDFQSSAQVKTREFLTEARQAHLERIVQCCRSLHLSLIDRIRRIQPSRPENSTWQDTSPCCDGCA